MSIHHTHAHARRAKLVQWLRTGHGWLGLWGAVLGLLFGFSGIWLNHRAILKLPTPEVARTETQVQLPDPLPTTPEALSAWLDANLHLGASRATRVERARAVPWDVGKSLRQPEKWTLNYSGTQSRYQVEYWVGNQSATVRQTNAGFIATLTNLHKGDGGSLPWVLVVDTLAGSLILLSLSGILLWMLTHRRRTVGLTILGCAIVVVAGTAVSTL